MHVMESPVHRTISRYTNAVPRSLSAIYDSSQRSTRDEDGLDRGHFTKGTTVEAAIGKFSEGLPLRPQRIYAIQKPRAPQHDDDEDDDVDDDDEEEDEDDVDVGSGDNDSENEKSGDSVESAEDDVDEEDDDSDDEELQERLAGGQSFEADKDEQRGTRMVNFFYQMYKSKKLYDLVLKLGDKEFAIHAVVFVEHSDKYYNLVCGGHLPLQEIILDKTTTPEAVEMVVEYLYTGEIKLTDHIVQPVLRCAQQLDLRHVIAKCQEYIRRRNDSSPTRELPTKVKSKGLFANSRDFLKLDVDTLCSVLADDDIDIDREVEVFYAALQWLDYNKGARQHHAVRVMECVRFALMPPSELATIVEVQAHLIRIPEIKDFLYQAYKYHALIYSKSHMALRVPSPKPRSTYQDDQWSFSDLKIRDDNTKSRTKKQIKPLRTTSERCVAGGVKGSESKTGDITPLVAHKPPRPQASSSDVKSHMSMKSRLQRENVDKGKTRSKASREIDKCEEKIRKNRSMSKISEVIDSASEDECVRPKCRSKPAELSKQQRAKLRSKSEHCRLRKEMSVNRNLRKFRSKPEPIRDDYFDAIQRYGCRHEDDVSKYTGTKNFVSRDSENDTEDDDSNEEREVKVPPRHHTQIHLIKKPPIPEPPTCSLSNQMLVGRLPIITEPPMKQDIYVFGGTDLECSDPNFPGRQVLRLACGSKQWEQVDALMPVPRNNHCALVVDSTVYIIGGALPVREAEDFFAQPNNTVIAFDAATCEWAPGAPMKCARLYFAAATWNAKIFVFGGQGVANSVLNSVECYEPVYDRWTSCTSMSTGRVGACAAEFRNKVFVIGGYAWCNGEATALRDCFTYEPLTDCWCQMTALARGLCYASMVKASDNIYLIGGAEEGSHESQPLVSVPFIRLYDPVNDNWRIISELKVPRHDCCAAVVASGKKIYVVGGLTLCNRPLVSVECFDTEYKVLLARVPKLPNPSAGTGVCVISCS